MECLMKYLINYLVAQFLILNLVKRLKYAHNSYRKKNLIQYLGMLSPLLSHYSLFFITFLIVQFDLVPQRRQPSQTNPFSLKEPSHSVETYYANCSQRSSARLPRKTHIHSNGATGADWVMLTASTAYKTAVRNQAAPA